MGDLTEDRLPAIAHLILHALVPLLAALVIAPRRWLRCWLIMLAAMVIDLDHLWADPIYDPGRCSIGFHPLHTLGPILIYILALIPRRTRIIGLGLCIHIALDALDCRLMTGSWCAWAETLGDLPLICDNP